MTVIESAQRLGGTGAGEGGILCGRTKGSPHFHLCADLASVFSSSESTCDALSAIKNSTRSFSASSCAFFEPVKSSPLFDFFINRGIFPRLLCFVAFLFQFLRHEFLQDGPIQEPYPIARFDDRPPSGVAECKIGQSARYLQGIFPWFKDRRLCAMARIIRCLCFRNWH